MPTPQQSILFRPDPNAYVLMRDTFRDVQSTLVSSTAYPGKGLRQVTGALLKTLAGALRGGSQTSSPVWGSSKILWTDNLGNGFARVPGRTFCALVTLEDFGSDVALGWDTATNTGDPRTVGHGWVNENGKLEAIAPGAKITFDSGTRNVRSAQYLIGVTLGDLGAVVWLSSFGTDDANAPAAGFTDQVGIPAYPSARVLWVNYADTTTPLYPYLSFLDSGNGGTTYPNGQCVQDARVVDPVSWSAVDALTATVDRFTRADSTTSLGTSTSGIAWATDAGTWGISSNQAYIQTASGFTRAYLANALPSGGDGIVSIFITAPNPATVGFGIMVRRQDSSNFLRLWNNSTNSIVLQTWVAGAFNATIGSTAFTWTAGQTYHWLLVMKGNKYRLWIDGVDVWGAWQTDSNNRFLTSRDVGLYSNNSAGNGTTRWDNLAIYPNTFTLPPEIQAGACPVVYVTGATLASDTFTDTDATALTSHSAEAGGAWTNILGTWTVQSNRASCAAASGSNMITQSLGTANAECSVDIITPASFPTTTVRAGICVRYVDSSNYLFVRLYKDSGTSEIEINETVAGSGLISHKVDLSAAAVAVNTTYTLKVQISADPNGGADLMHVLLDGKLRLSYKLRAPNAGTRFGLYRENTDDGCVFDNWSAKAL
jgi:hypothetical protein